jgi:ATP-dependent Clp protease ATP-binding subunit ClpA
MVFSTGGTATGGGLTGIKMKREPEPNNLMLTPRLQQTLTRAALEAEKLGDTYIGTEHILLAMLALEQGNAWRVMHAAGLEYKSAKFALTVMKST